jgi:hypothetical protein
MGAGEALVIRLSGCLVGPLGAQLLQVDPSRNLLVVV